MGKKKQTSTTQSTYSHVAPPETADMTALRGIKAEKDPGIPFGYGKQREALNSSYLNPTGAYTSNATRDNASRVLNNSLAQEEAQANAAGEFDANNANFGRQATIAGMTAPQLVQTGGTNTQTSQGGFWSGLLQQGIGAGAQVGAAALT